MSQQRIDELESWMIGVICDLNVIAKMYDDIEHKPLTLDEMREIAANARDQLTAVIQDRPVLVSVPNSRGAYNRLLKIVTALVTEDPDPNSQAGKQLLTFASAIEAYEKQGFR